MAPTTRRNNTKKKRLELPIQGNSNAVSSLFLPVQNRLPDYWPSPDDPILISSDDSNDSTDSNIQCITNHIPTPQPPDIQMPHIRMPIIASYTSMSTGSTGNGFNRRCPGFTSQSKSLTYIILDSIDLTSDDDDGANNT